MPRAGILVLERVAPVSRVANPICSDSYDGAEIPLNASIPGERMIMPKSSEASLIPKKQVHMHCMTTRCLLDISRSGEACGVFPTKIKLSISVTYAKISE